MSRKYGASHDFDKDEEEMSTNMNIIHERKNRSRQPTKRRETAIKRVSGKNFIKKYRNDKTRITSEFGTVRTIKTRAAG
jgi:hypothetical protein